VEGRLVRRALASRIASRQVAYVRRPLSSRVAVGDVVQPVRHQEY